MTDASGPSSNGFPGNVANISRDGAITIVPAPPGPPQRIDGYTIGAILHLDGEPPHRGEMHPDGDEFLYLVSGTMELILDDGDQGTIGQPTKVLLHAGDAFVVPRGVWHQLETVEPSYLIHVTPGPRGDHRPRH